MSRTRALTILSGRFPAKRAFVTGAASGLGRAVSGLLATDGWQLGLLDTMRAQRADGELAQRLMQRASHDADDAAAVLLLAAARGASHVVWPREYRLLWWLKRGFPAWFVRRAGRMGGRLAAQADRPRG